MHHPKERGRSPSSPETPTANNERGICRDLEPSHVAEPRWQKSRGHVDAQPRQLRSKSQPILITGYGDQRRRSDHRCEQTEGERVSIPTVLEYLHLSHRSINHGRCWCVETHKQRPPSQPSGLPTPLAALFFLCVLFCNAGPDLAARRPVNIRRREGKKKRRNDGASIALSNVQLLHVGLRPAAAGRASPLQVWRPWKHHMEGGKRGGFGSGRLQVADAV